MMPTSAHFPSILWYKGPPSSRRHVPAPWPPAQTISCGRKYGLVQGLACGTEAQTMWSVALKKLPMGSAKPKPHVTNFVWASKNCSYLAVARPIWRGLYSVGIGDSNSRIMKFILPWAALNSGCWILLLTRLNVAPSSQMFDPSTQLVQVLFTNTAFKLKRWQLAADKTWVREIRTPPQPRQLHGMPTSSWSIRRTKLEDKSTSVASHPPMTRSNWSPVQGGKWSATASPTSARNVNAARPRPMVSRQRAHGTLQASRAPTQT
mmetsp:Transcript_60596/g.174836  ORF Transcript_60596/g.174836 Transcript_60596/m.174836 type:complete len:263 (+) Transcript_60596:1200-1988(+)